MRRDDNLRRLVYTSSVSPGASAVQAILTIELGSFEARSNRSADFVGRPRNNKRPHGRPMRGILRAIVRLVGHSRFEPTGWSLAHKSASDHEIRP